MTGHSKPRRKARAHGTAELVAFAGCALAGAEGGLAQDPGNVTIDASDCLELTSPEERLACYEAQIGEALGGRGESRPADTAGPDPSDAGAAGAPAPARADNPRAPARARTEPAAERVAPAQQADEDFGLRPPGERDDEAPEMVGTVAALRERAPNQYMISLENGQVWYQRTPERYWLRVGHRVRIYSTSWGAAYRLAADELGGHIQVERVR